MGSYTVIADVSRTIVELLRKKMTPEPVQKEELIGLCPPNEPGNFVLGLHLYNIENNKSMGSIGRTNLESGLQQNPPTPLTLYYMLTVYSKTDSAKGSIDEQRIIGKAIQVLNDNNRLINEMLYGTLKDNNETVEVTAIDLNLEEKMRIWSLFNSSYRLSVYYSVGPIYLDSEKIQKTKPVVDINIAMRER